MAWNYNAVDWAYGDGCVHNPVYYDHNEAGQEGYGQDGFNWATGAICDFAYSSTYSHYTTSDASGCSSGGKARIRFDRNSIHGNPNGTFSIYDGASWCVNDLGPYSQFFWAYF